jgi:hypothetical protein
VVFYELLTGELPLGRFSPPSEKVQLDARVDAIVFRALAKERELRQQSAGEVKTQVEGLGSTTTAMATPRPIGSPDDHPISSSQWLWRWMIGLAVAGVALSVAAAGAAFLARWLQQRGFGSASGLWAGLLPAVTEGLLILGHRWWAPKRPNQLESGDQPSRLPAGYWMVILSVVTLMLGGMAHALWSRDAVNRNFPQAMLRMVARPMASDESSVRLKIVERKVSSSQIRLGWTLQTRRPTRGKLSLGAQEIRFPLAPNSRGEYTAQVEVTFDRVVLAQEVRVTVSGPATAEAKTLVATLKGDPAALLAQTNLLVADDLSLDSRTPIWIAFAGNEQVRLEILPDPADMAAAPRAVSDSHAETETGLPQTVPTGHISSAALKWHYAWEKLQENRKRLEVGVGSNQEVYAAERDLAVAEAVYRGVPPDVARANLAYAEKMLELIRKMASVGRATGAEVNEATLLLTQANEALTKALELPTLMDVKRSERP